MPILIHSLVASLPFLVQHTELPSPFSRGTVFESTPKMSGLTPLYWTPGWVQTDMGNGAAKGWGMESAPDTVEKSTSGMVDVITNGTKEQYGGKVVLYNGEVQEW